MISVMGGQAPPNNRDGLQLTEQTKADIRKQSGNLVKGLLIAAQLPKS